MPTDKPAPSPTLPKGAAAPSPWAVGVETQVSVSGPAELRVAADGENDSTLWAQAVDAKGNAIGPATKLRKTTGTVDGITAIYDGVTVWVAWRARHAKPDGRVRGIEGLAGYDISMKSTVKAKTLRFFPHDDVGTDAPIRMVARPGVGAGVAVASFAGVMRCRGMFFEEEGLVDCQQLAVDIIGADGSVERTGQFQLEGGDPSLDDIVDVGEGVVTSFHAWRGGPLTDVSFTSYTEVPGASRSPSSCDYPPISLAWVDGGLLSICPDPDEDSPGRFRYSALDGTPKDPSVPGDDGTRIHELRYGCKAGRPTARLSWKGGHLQAPAEAFDEVEARKAMASGKCKGPTIE